MPMTRLIRSLLPSLILLGGALALQAAEASVDHRLVKVQDLLTKGMELPGAEADVKEQLRKSTDPALRLEIISAVVRARPSWLGTFIRAQVADTDPRIRATVVDAMLQVRPVTAEDLVRVRALIADPDLAVMQAACRFAVRVQDDGAIPHLVDRLEEDSTGTVRKALTTLAGVDMGSVDAWRGRLQDQARRISGLAEELQSAASQGKTEAFRETLSRLVLLHHERVEVGKVLMTYIRGRDPVLAKLARAALDSLGGPLAETLPPPMAKVVAIAPPPPPPPPSFWSQWDPLAVAVVAVITGIVGMMGWFLLRAKPAEPVSGPAVSKRSGSS